MPTTPATSSYLDNEWLFCDWTLTATHCKEQNITQLILIFSTVMHIFAAIYTIWLIIQRNGGVNRRIFTCLFTKVVNRIQPRPINCIIMCIALCCISKPISNLILVFDVLRGSLWVRTLLEQVYWLTIAIECTMHIVGVLYTIPITKREGHVAIYEPDRVEGCEPQWPVSLIYPSTLLNNLFIINSPFIITILGIGPSLVSALLYDRGDYEAARVWLTVSHIAWSGIIFVLVPLLLYYGIKFSRILKINIIIAETRLGVPPSRFGISNLMSKSPARYLFIVLQITVFGASVFAMLAALMMSSFGIFRDQLLSAKLGLFSHFYTFAWTCVLVFVMIVKLILVHIQLVRFGRKQHLFSNLYKAMDGEEDSHSTGAEPDPTKGPTGGGACTGKEWDMEFMAGVDSAASRTHLTSAKAAIPRTSNVRVPSSITRCSSLENSLMREHPRYFTSDRIAALPSTSYLSPAVLPDNSLQGPAVPPLSSSPLMNPRHSPSQQRQDSGVHPPSDVKSSPCIVYGARQEAFRDLGIFRE
ncbi:hypothetical protein BGZ72_007659 [Mortierella alpina]|nr:hypothetical protein BGZ72_007659 [Mortierella alpina]